MALNKEEIKKGILEWCEKENIKLDNLGQDSYNKIVAQRVTEIFQYLLSKGLVEEQHFDVFCLACDAQYSKYYFMKIMGIQ